MSYNGEVNAIAVEKVKKMLNGYVQDAIDIDYQRSRYDRMRIKFGSISAVQLTDMPKAPSPVADRQAIFIERMIDLSDLIEEKVENHHQKEKEINEILERINDSMEKEVIRSRYIDASLEGQDTMKKWAEVTKDLFGKKNDYFDKQQSYMRRAQRIHNSAILSMAEVIDI